MSTSSNEKLNVPASMREVSRTSPISAASRVVSPAISERNELRWSGESSRQRCWSDSAAPITAAIGLRSSWETSETKSARRLERPETAGREDLRAAPRGGDHVREAVFGEHDRHPVERDQSAELPDEDGEGRLELERRAEGAGAAIGGLEQVDAPSELVAQPLRLDRAVLGDVGLLVEPVREHADDRAHDELEPDRERDVVRVEGEAEARVPEGLCADEERRHDERHDESAAQTEHEGRLDHGQEQERL